MAGGDRSARKFADRGRYPITARVQQPWAYRPLFHQGQATYNGVMVEVQPWKWLGPFIATDTAPGSHELARTYPPIDPEG